MFDYLLGAQPIQVPDPVQQMGRMLSLAQVANANQLAQYNLAKAQRADTAATAVGQALGGVDLMDDNAVRQVMQNLDPDARQAFLGVVQNARKAKAEADQKSADAALKNADVTKVRAAFAGNTAQYLMSKPDVSNQDIQAANANGARLGLPADYFTPPPGADPNAHWGSIAGSAMDAAKQVELAGQAASRQETVRHNTAEEGLTASRDANTAAYQRGELGIGQQNANTNARNAESNAVRARAAVVTADPFGISGLNTGAPGASPALPSTVSPADSQLFQVTLADAQKNGYPTFKVNGQTYNTADVAKPQGAAAAVQSGLTGDDFLKTLSPQVAGMIKAMVEGRMSPPAGAALRSPQTQQLIMLANQYDPSFDATTWGARAAMAKDWGDQGAIGKSNLAINTVIGHLGDLKKSADQLNNTSVPVLNRLINGFETNVLGDPRYTEFNANAGAVAKELERAYRGTGGSQGDIDQMKGELSAANSPQQLTGVIQKYVDLLQSKIDANADAYRKTMGKEPPPLLSPKAQATQAALRGGQGAPTSATTDKQTLLMQARDAINKGADPAKVKARLQQMGVTDTP